MRDQLQSARELLDLMERRMSEATSPTWGSTLRSYKHALETDPLLRHVLSSVEQDPLLTHPSRAPDDLDEWGRRAWATVRFYANGGKAQTNTILSDAITDTGGRERKHFGWCHRGYVVPLVDWLRRELAAGAELEVVLEQWLRRTEAFPPWGIDNVDEKRLQLDLHRYLFDTGVEFRDSGREFSLPLGRVDFLLRTGEAVAVELKLWRDRNSAGDLTSWFQQAQCYPRDLGIKRAYLIIGNVSSKRKLVLAPELHPPETLLWEGVEVHVRVVDLARPAPSDDRRKTIVLDGAGLLGVP